jgi:hypothetical protein
VGGRRVPCPCRVLSVGSAGSPGSGGGRGRVVSEDDEGTIQGDPSAEPLVRRTSSREDRDRVPVVEGLRALRTSRVFPGVRIPTTKVETEDDAVRRQMRDVPARLATGAFIFHTGREKWNGPDERAKAIQPGSLWPTPAGTAISKGHLDARDRPRPDAVRASREEPVIGRVAVVGKSGGSR